MTTSTLRLSLLAAASLLAVFNQSAAAGASFKKPPGSTVMTVDGANYGYPGTKVSYIYFKSDSARSVYGVVSQVKIPADMAKNFRNYGKELERSYSSQYGNVRVTVRRNSYTVKGSAYGLSFYARGILKGRTVYAVGGYAQSSGTKKNAMWKMIKNFRVR
jgi:hypothetical protein